MADLNWLLLRLVETVPHTRSAVLLSADGIAKSWHGLDTEGADQLSAMASGLCSLAQGVGTRFGGGEGVRQVVTELDEIVLFVTAASVGTVLAVLANREVDAGILSYEMGRLSAQVPAHLETPSRADSTRVSLSRVLPVRKQNGHSTGEGELSWAGVRSDAADAR